MKKKWVTVMLAGSLIGSVAMPFTMGNHSYAVTLEKVDLAVQEQLREDLEVFYKGLKGFPTYSSSHAGGISAIGNNAFPVAINPDTILNWPLKIGHILPKQLIRNFLGRILDFFVLTLILFSNGCSNTCIVLVLP